MAELKNRKFKVIESFDAGGASLQEYEWSSYSVDNILTWEDAVECDFATIEEFHQHLQEITPLENFILNIKNEMTMMTTLKAPKPTIPPTLLGLEISKVNHEVWLSCKDGSLDSTHIIINGVEFPIDYNLYLNILKYAGVEDIEDKEGSDHNANQQT